MIGNELNSSPVVIILEDPIAISVSEFHISWMSINSKGYSFQVTHLNEMLMSNCIITKVYGSFYI